MLRAIYKVGSAVILPKHNDEDYCYYYDTNKERLEAVISNREHDKDIHFTLVNNATKVCLYSYAYPFCKLIEGEDLGLKDFSIFDVKDKYIKLLKKCVKIFPRESKLWYHIYIAVKMFKKGKMSLTKKEIETAQKIHDRGVNCEEYNYIIDYLSK